jgi:hypothetical protein
MNKTVAIINLNEEEGEEEEETDLLAIQRRQYIEEKYARKNRWIKGVVSDDDRTSLNASNASISASSCRNAVEETLNKPDAYANYKNLLTKMDKTCVMNL